MVKYSQICSFQFLHNYYENNFCRGINVQPTLATVSWMDQYGGIFKSRGNSWYLLLSKTNDLNKIKEDNEDVQLNFYCYSQNPDFVKITDYPVDELGCFNFSSAGIKLTGQEKKYLNPVFKSSNTAIKEIAQIEIEVSGLFSGGEIINPVFEMQFPDRIVPWKYYIFNNSGINYSTLKLEGAKSGLFTGPTDEYVEGVGKAQLFDSGEEKFPIKEIGDVKLSLYGEQDDQGQIILIDHMPNPGPASLQLASNSSQQLNATMYIYI
ncbi:MAG: hypothetical protein AAFZ15_23435 [Bacteroidota bacterium]